jgi:hypothetical protein
VRVGHQVEEEVRAVLDHLSAQDRALARIVEALVVKLNGPPPAATLPGVTSKA